MRIMHVPESIGRTHGRSGAVGPAGGEKVLVVSAVRKTEATAQALPSENGYEVVISDEALARNSEVRAHERSHLAALGPAAASGIIYHTVKGPGGETIAVGGRIAVDLSEVPGDPAATLRKALSVIAAANAPSRSSAGDQRTAARAYALAIQARQQLSAGLDIQI